MRVPSEGNKTLGREHEHKTKPKLIRIKEKRLEIQNLHTLTLDVPRS
jgi:hypothetical protein